MIDDAISSLTEAEIDEIRAECQQTGRDFLVMAVARALKKPYDLVTPDETEVAHELLFTYLHSGRFPVQTYQMTMGGREFWLSFEQARRSLQHGFSLGKLVRTVTGGTRDITDQERADLLQ